MLTALTVLPGREVDTKWYLKLDVDVVATSPGTWILDEWFTPNEDGVEPVFVTSPWGYSKPADVIERLDRWADGRQEFSGTRPLELRPKPGDQLIAHSRIISWCFFAQTGWTREVTSCCGERLPVPSQDTYLWYCAERRGDFYRRISMKKFGWAHTNRRKQLKQLARESLAKASKHSKSVRSCDSVFEEVGHLGRPNLDHEDGVLYLLTGSSHAARLVVSLVSLRAQYDGPIALLTTQSESHSIGQMIAADKRLGVIHRAIDPPYSGRNASYLSKIAILEQSPFSRTLFLDADTVVVDRIESLFSFPEETQIVATMFGGWRTDRRPIRNRIEKWRRLRIKRFLGMSWGMFLDSAQNGHPAINTGVFVVRRGAEAVRIWKSLAEIGRNQFICDEIALQILLHHVPSRLVDDRWNCSPRHGKARDHAHIWHMHGGKHLSPNGRDLWWPRYLSVVENDFCQIQRWTPAGDRELQMAIESEGPDVALLSGDTR